MVLWASLAAQEEKNVNPTINEKFMQSELKAEEWVERFEGESREVYTARRDVVKSLALRRGQRVADVGAGTGLYVQLFAEEVGPSGRVYAIDIAPKFLELIESRAKKSGYTQVVTILGEDRHSNLPEESVDVIFHSDTYHHFEYPRTLTRDLARALVEGGELFVLDFERIPGVSENWILDHVRADKQTVTQEIENSGFELIQEIELPQLRENYLLRFRKL